MRLGGDPAGGEHQAAWPVHRQETEGRLDVHLKQPLGVGGSRAHSSSAAWSVRTEASDHFSVNGTESPTRARGQVVDGCDGGLGYRMSKLPQLRLLDLLVAERRIDLVA